MDQPVEGITLRDPNKTVVSIDIETTGLNPGAGHLLEFGAVVDSFDVPIIECPVFRRLLVTNDKMIGGQPIALAMNADLIAEIAAQMKLPAEQQSPDLIEQNRLMGEFQNWLREVGVDLSKPMCLAGKNFANFDLKFLEAMGFSKVFKFRHRILDPGNMYWDFSEDGTVLPDTKKCLERAALPNDVKHRAVDDARDVLRLIRTHLGMSL